MTIAELQARAAELDAAGSSSHSPRIEIHKKFSIPAACLVFALLGVALGATYKRDGKFVGIARGLAVIFIYYALMWLGQALAQGGQMPPWLAMWLPNLVLGAAGLALLWRQLKPIRTRFSLPAPLLTRFRGSETTRSSGWSGRIPDLPWLRPSLLDTYVGLLYFRTLGLCLAGMAGLFYISTFIDLSDNLFKGTATTGMLLQYLLVRHPAVSLLHHRLGRAPGRHRHDRGADQEQRADRDARLRHQSLPHGGAAAGGRGHRVGRVVRHRGNGARTGQPPGQRVGPADPRSGAAQLRRPRPGLAHRRRRHRLSLPGLQPERARAERADSARFHRRRVESSIARRTFARVAKAGPDADTSRGWQARDGWTRTFTDNLTVREFTRFEEQTLTLEPPATFVTQAPPPSQMNYAQLSTYVRELRASGYDVREDEVALYRKVAFPLVTIVMTLIGVPFAVSTGRRGALYGVGAGIVLALVYWTMISVTGAFGAGGAMPPMLAAWTPNLVFGAGAVYLLLTVRT